MTTLDTIINKYNARSFEITDLHGDNEFDKAAFKDFLQPALLHIYSETEHVGPIERSVRTVKQRCRSTCNETPYRSITILMVRSLIESVTDTLNIFPSQTGISNSVSPASIVEAKPKMD